MKKNKDAEIVLNNNIQTFIVDFCDMAIKIKIYLGKKPKIFLLLLEKMRIFMDHSDYKIVLSKKVIKDVFQRKKITIKRQLY